MKNIGFVFVLLIVSSCCSQKQNYNSFVYCGYAEDNYYEFWINQDKVALYNQYMGFIRDFDFEIQTDSLFLFYEGDLEYAFQIISYNSK